MKKLIYHALMIFSVMVLLGSGLMGAFAAMGACAAVWGEGILFSALGNQPDRFHPAYWMFMIIAMPGTIIGFLGGLPVCLLLQRYAKWHLGGASKPNLHAWLSIFVQFDKAPY